MTAGVYRIWLSESHFYVGRSSDINQRCVRHLKNLKAEKHPNPHMQAVYNKYEVFRYEVVEVANEERSKELEQILIDTYLSDPFCVNICPSAEFPTRKGMKNSPEHRAKISASRKGLTFGPEARRNMSKGQKRRLSAGWSDELRAAMMKTRDTPEYRAKMKAARALQLARRGSETDHA